MLVVTFNLNGTVETHSQYVYETPEECMIVKQILNIGVMEQKFNGVYFCEVINAEPLEINE
jgi:hypothetical protein